jgi:Xaa-Pro aminopeptidase
VEAVDLYPAARLELVRDSVRNAGLDAVLLTPGPDLRYVTGYDAKQLERLTCLAVPAHGDPALFVPRLELPAAQASPAGSLGLEILPWEETADPFAMVAARLGNAAAVGLSDRMWALFVLRFRDALPSARLALASGALRPLRIRKSPAEVAALREAGRPSTGYTRGSPAGCTPGVPSARSARTSPRPSWPRGTPPWTS